MREYDVERPLSSNDELALFRLKEGADVSHFSCGDQDLDDFFRCEAISYARQLLGKTYVLATRGETPQIVAMITLANASIRSDLMPPSSRNKIQRSIPNAKRTRMYPAVLVGRLGVALAFRGRHVGGYLLDLMKFLLAKDDYLTGCRFLVVDAYNTARTLGFYAKNGFKLLYADERVERETHHVPEGERLHTRLMYYDLFQK